jgi:gas vesicle protein
MAVLGAAAFLLFGPEGKKHRKDLKSWMLKMKGEVMEKMEKAKDLSAETYKEIVNGVEAKYKAMKHVDGDMLAKEVADLKKNWRAVSKMAKSKPTKKAKK